MKTQPTNLALVGLLGAALFLLGGCGPGGYGYWEVGIGGTFEDPCYDGYCYATLGVDNLAPEFVEGFYLSPAASGEWTSELLGLPLAPGETALLGDFEEGVYDAEADTGLGDLVTWFDVQAPAAEETVFEVW